MSIPSLAPVASPIWGDGGVSGFGISWGIRNICKENRWILKLTYLNLALFDLINVVIIFLEI